MARCSFIKFKSHHYQHCMNTCRDLITRDLLIYICDLTDVVGIYWQHSWNKINRVQIESGLDQLGDQQERMCRRALVNRKGMHNCTSSWLRGLTRSTIAGAFCHALSAPRANQTRAFLVGTKGRLDMLRCVRTLGPTGCAIMCHDRVQFPFDCLDWSWIVLISDIPQSALGLT